MTRTPKSFSARAEDHALERVPLTERRSGWSLMTNTAGIASTLVQIAIAAAVTGLVGVGYGILAGVIVAVFGGALGWGVGHVAYVSGTSSTVTARHYGLGRRGSVLASLVFAFMILGFLALENALLYYGTLFAFGWAPSLLNAIGIYGVLTIAWVLLTVYGMRVVQATSTLLLIAFLALTIVVAIIALVGSSASLGDILATGPADPATPIGPTFAAAVAIFAGSAGALALVDADYARYARSTRDVGILAIGGSIMIDIVVVVLGAVIVGASRTTVTNFLQGHPATAATQVGNTIPEKIGWLIGNNTGAYFIILFGVAGFILMYIAQIKAQVLNTYSGSLSLSNLVEGVTGRNPGRVLMVVIGNVIALIMIGFNILGLIGSFLGILGVTTTALATVIIADYFIVRRRQPGRLDQTEDVNWAGVIAVIGGSVLGSVLSETGVTPLGFLVSLVFVGVVYPLLRLFVLKPTGQVVQDLTAPAVESVS